MMKLMIVGRRRGGMTRAALHRYMLDVHGAMVVRQIGIEPAVMPRRYVQNHVIDGSTRMPGAAGAGTDPFIHSRDFVTQVWFNNPAEAGAALQAPFYLEQLQPDEDRFVDQGSVVKLPVAETLLFGDDPLPGTALGKTPGTAPGTAHNTSKLLVFHQRAPGASAEALGDALLAQWQPLWADAAHGIRRLVRNTVLQRPGQPAPPADVIDEVWLGDDAAAQALGQHWQSLMDRPVLAHMLVPGAGFVLLAHAHVLFAG